MSDDVKYNPSFGRRMVEQLCPSPLPAFPLYVMFTPPVPYTGERANITAFTLDAAQAAKWIEEMPDRSQEQVYRVINGDAEWTPMFLCDRCGALCSGVAGRDLNIQPRPMLCAQCKIEDVAK